MHAAPGPERIASWIEDYRRAWEEKDADAAVALFTADAEYRSHPLQEPARGSDGVRGYWEAATGTQERVSVRMGRPFVDGVRVIVEFWATLDNESQPITIPGCLLLTFTADGRCAALREYWHIEPGRHEPHAGWGE